MAQNFMAVIIVGVSLAAARCVFTWTQNRTSAGVPTKRGDLMEAIAAGTAVAMALVAVVTFMGASLPMATNNSPTPTPTPAVPTSPSPRR